MVSRIASSAICIYVHYSFRLIGLERASESLRLCRLVLLLILSSEHQHLSVLINPFVLKTPARRVRSMMKSIYAQKTTSLRWLVNKGRCTITSRLNRCLRYRIQTGECCRVLRKLMLDVFTLTLVVSKLPVSFRRLSVDRMN